MRFFHQSRFACNLTRLRHRSPFAASSPGASSLALAAAVTQAASTPTKSMDSTSKYDMYPLPVSVTAHEDATSVDPDLDASCFKPQRVETVANFVSEAAAKFAQDIEDQVLSGEHVRVLTTVPVDSIMDDSCVHETVTIAMDEVKDENETGVSPSAVRVTAASCKSLSSSPLRHNDDDEGSSGSAASLTSFHSPSVHTASMWENAYDVKNASPMKFIPIQPIMMKKLNFNASPSKTNNKRKAEEDLTSYIETCAPSSSSRPMKRCRRTVRVCQEAQQKLLAHLSRTSIFIVVVFNTLVHPFINEEMMQWNTVADTRCHYSKLFTPAFLNT